MGFRSFGLFCSVLLLSAFSVVQGNDFLALATALNATRDSQALYELLKQITFEAQTSNNSMNVAALSAASELDLTEPCKSHYSYYKMAMNTMSWAFNMYDSSTKFPPSSVLEGAMIHLGNFDECLAVRDVSYNNESVFQGQHCLVSYRFKKKANATARQEMLPMLMSIALKMAQCVPSSCNTADTAVIAKDVLGNVVNIIDMMGIELLVGVEELDCHTAAPREFSSEDMIACSILAFFAGLVVFSTCYDIFTMDNKSRSNLPVAFSLYTNGKKLLATSSSGGDTLHCVHGIRFISMAWIILCHRYQGTMSEPAINMKTFLHDSLPDWRKAGITSGTVAVDTFFVLSGLLVTYVFLRQVHKTNYFNVPLYYIHRYVRLTPALAILMLLRATLLTHSGSGPLWDSAVASERDKCVQYWWTNLLYVQIYVNPAELCINQGWYLAVDMQLYWLSPLLLVPLWKWPIVGLAMAGLLSVAGCIANGLIYYYGEYAVNYFDLISSPKMVDYVKYVYYPAYARYVPYVFGMVLGYLLADIRIKERKIKFPKVVTITLWLISAALLLIGIFISQLFQQSWYVYDAVDAAVYSALVKPAWALGVAMVIFLCATGHGCFPNTILSWEWFQPLSRLTYSAYLVHISVQISQTNSARSQIFLDDMTLVPLFFGDLMITLLFSVAMSLVFESPFIALERELLGGHKSTPKSKEVTNYSGKETAKEDEVTAATANEAIEEKTD